MNVRIYPGTNPIATIFQDTQNSDLYKALIYFSNGEGASDALSVKERAIFTAKKCAERSGLKFLLPLELCTDSAKPSTCMSVKPFGDKFKISIIQAVENSIISVSLSEDLIDSFDQAKRGAEDVAQRLGILCEPHFYVPTKPTGSTVMVEVSISPAGRV